MKKIILMLMIVLVGCAANDNNSIANTENSELYKRDGSHMAIDSTDFEYKDKNYSTITRILTDSLNRYDIETGVRYTFNYTPINLYTFESKISANNKLNIITDNGRLLVFKTLRVGNFLYFINSAGVESFRYNTERVTDFTDSGFLDQISVTFPPQTNSICDCHGEESKKNHRFDRMENCGKYDFNTCYWCGHDTCNQDTKCDIGRAVSGPAFYISLIAVCRISQMFN